MSESPSAWPALSFAERRVLGVLVEKQKTTDTYPLTLNSLVTGCNQKSNRDPLLDLSDVQVEEAMADVQKKGLAMRLIGGRVDKWKHNLYDVWKITSAELAILTELLLRGPQTEGELRARASRMDDIADVDALRQLLVPLKERKLVVYLGPENRRGSMLTHGFHDTFELERLAKAPQYAASDESPSQPLVAGARVSVPASDEIGELRREMESLRKEFTALREIVERLQQELGIAPK